MTILWVLLEPACSFYELFASLGSPTTGRGIDFAPFWSETRRVLPVMAYIYTEAPPERGTFFRLQERYVRKFGLQAATTSNKGLTRFRQSLHFSFLPNKTRSRSRPSDNKGGRSFRLWDNGGTRSHKKIFRPLGPLFGLKIRGAGPLPYIRHRRLCSPTFGIIFWCSIFNFANRCRWITASVVLGPRPFVH